MLKLCSQEVYLTIDTDCDDFHDGGGQCNGNDGTIHEFKPKEGLDMFPNVLELQTVYPNSFEKNLTVRLHTFQTNHIEIRIFDSTGSLAKVSNHVLTEGMKDIELNLADISVSIYLLEIVSSEGQRIVQRISR